MQKVKALVLLSGGLDSMLAAKVLMEQGIEVVGLSFISYFFNAEKAFKATKQLGIPLIAYSIAPDHLAMVKEPKYGYGKNMNPCIDCHSMMIRKAKEIMEGEEVVFINPDNSVKAVSQVYDFVATGEVLGQRPMSQTKVALQIVAKFSGIGDKLVRPLSGQLLDLTEPEKEGKIKKEALLDISGRSRSRQQELAKKFGITEYPSPAGGCLLTDPAFGIKLKELFDNWPKCTGQDVELLKHGRIFWLSLNEEKVLVVIGRDQKDSEALLKVRKPGDVLLTLVNEVGPTVLLRRFNPQLTINNYELETEIPAEFKIEELDFDNLRSEEEILQVVAQLTVFYSRKLVGKKVKVKIEK